MNPQSNRTTNTVKVVSVAVCTVTTAAMCANLVAISHAPTHAQHSVKLIYIGHAPKTARG